MVDESKINIFLICYYDSQCMRRDLAQININYHKSKVDQWGSDWRGSLAFWHQFCIDSVMLYLDSYHDASVPLNILEIGCGSGVFTEKINAALSSKYTITSYLAADVSSKAIEKAKLLFPNSHVTYTTVHENLTEVSHSKFNLIFGLQFLFYLTPDERRIMYNKIKSLCTNNAVVVLSSNTRSSGEDADYINQGEFIQDVSHLFTLKNEYDLFTSQYVELIEAKILKFSRLYPIKLLLKNKLFPKLFHTYIKNRATEAYPFKRVRMLILQNKVL